MISNIWMLPNGEKSSDYIEKYLNAGWIMHSLYVEIMLHMNIP